MGRRKNKDQKDVTAWLLAFEQQAGVPVVVSVLIEDGRIGFVGCLRKRAYFDDSSDVDDDSPTIDFLSARKETQSKALLNSKSYIG